MPAAPQQPRYGGLSSPQSPTIRPISPCPGNARASIASVMAPSSSCISLLSLNHSNSNEKDEPVVFSPPARSVRSPAGISPRQFSNRLKVRTFSSTSRTSAPDSPAMSPISLTSSPSYLNLNR